MLLTVSHVTLLDRYTGGCNRGVKGLESGRGGDLSKVGGGGG